MALIPKRSKEEQRAQAKLIVQQVEEALEKAIQNELAWVFREEATNRKREDGGCSLRIDVFPLETK